MMLMTRTMVSAALAGALLLCSATVSSAKDYPVFQTVGKGKFATQLVLKDTLTGKPLPNTRYELFAPDVMIAGTAQLPDTQTSVIYGTTDANGRTAKVLTSQKIRNTEWSLIRVVGEGDKGNAFYLREGKGYYAIDVENGALYCGKSNEQGSTDYLAVKGNRYMDLFELDPLTAADLAFCQAVVAQIDRLPADVDSATLFSALYDTYRPAASQLDQGLRVLATRKLMAVAILSKNDEMVNISIDERLKDGADGELYNSIGYDLIDGNMQVERGLSLVEKALAESPNNHYIQDSKGWGLYRLGRLKEAIEWLDKSSRTFLNQGEQDVSALVENYAHRAQAYHQIGNVEEAQRLLNKGYELQPDNTLIQDAAKRLHLNLGEVDQPVALVPPAAI